MIGMGLRLRPPRQHGFRFWFFYAVSYWVAVSGIVASQLLAVKGVVCILNDEELWHESFVKYMDTIGDVAFTVSVYLQYVELINVQENERHVYLWPAWGPIRQHVRWSQFVGTLTFVSSMILFDVAAVAQHFDLDTAAWKVLLLEVPAVVGGLGFCIGGICEVIENWDRARASVEWRAAMLDCLGGFCYLVGGFCGVPEGPTAEVMSKWCYLGGISMYVVAYILRVVMWRANSFGFLLLRDINHAVDDQLPGRFSVRAVVFLVIYCWLFTCCLLKGTAHVLLMDWKPDDDNLWDLADCAVWLLIVSIVLAIHSCITSVPNEQPYRLCYKLVRGALTLCALTKTYQLMNIVRRGV